MRITIVCIGRPRGTIAKAIAEFEDRIGHYFRFDVIEVRETVYRGQPIEQLLDSEADAILARIPAHSELVALHRLGRHWSSEEFARYLGKAQLESRSGVTFVIGGAYGIADRLISRADRTLSLSAMTFPHEIARLMFVEQIYRAGTILRGEPYHKGKEK